MQPYEVFKFRKAGKHTNKRLLLIEAAAFVYISLYYAIGISADTYNVLNGEALNEAFKNKQYRIRLSKFDKENKKGADMLAPFFVFI